MDFYNDVCFDIVWDNAFRDFLKTRYSFSNSKVTELETLYTFSKPCDDYMAGLYLHFFDSQLETSENDYVWGE
jgi:hypothetical protein